jgi:hypothetical protein
MYNQMFASSEMHSGAFMLLLLVLAFHIAREFISDSLIKCVKPHVHPPTHK